MKSSCCFVFVSLSLPCALAAQTVSLTANVATTCVATAGPQTWTATLPSGAMPAYGNLYAATVPGPPSASASLYWSTMTLSTGSRTEFSQSCWLAAGGNAATCGLLDVRLELTAAAPTLVGMRASHEAALTAGVPAPLARVDFGDDGSFELIEAHGGPSLTTLTIGPVPTRVRVLMDAGLTIPGNVYSRLVVDMLPNTNTGSALVATGCSGNFDHAVQPRFDGGVDVTFGSFLGTAGVVVLGLQPQPIVLTTLPYAACLLIPSPDALVVLVPPDTLTLPLPPAVRPVTIWSQAVGLELGLVTTNAFRTDAL